jgi:Flp pilus assembly pilin Flp
VRPPLIKIGNLMKRSVKSTAQSIIEYTILITIVSAALAAMVFYLRRGMDVRMRHLAQELNETNR